MAFGEINALGEAVHQSPPIDTSAPYDTASLAGKTILITGGASGFGAAFARRWAKHGAHIAVGDIDDATGEALVAELRATTPGGQYHHYQHCDVTSWQSQVDFFRAAVGRSATGSIHAVVPNAGIADSDSPANRRGFENPAGLPGAGPNADPCPPPMAVMDINGTGVLYSVHLALYWLPKNDKAKGDDRHILFLSSIAGLVPLPGQALYTASKHAVTGLFRALRGTGHVQGVRVNMLCPYFVDTNILPTSGVLMLAGGGTAKIEDVVDAGTRFMADEAIAGRSVVIGPRMLLKVGLGGGDAGEEASAAAVDLVADDGVQVLGGPVPDATGKLVPSPGQAVWECYGHDYENSEVFMNRYVRLLNLLTLLRGWGGFVRDVVGVLWLGRREPPPRKLKK